MPTCD